MEAIIFKRARIFDGASESLTEGHEVLVADGIIQQISAHPIQYAGAARTVDCGGRVLMPGLIDAHVHVYAARTNIQLAAQLPPTYIAHYASRFMASSLERGFTTLRDVGGADVGLASALRDGLLPGPRLFYGGRVISQTGGHGDMRPGDQSLPHGLCACECHCDNLAIVADGVDAVRKAVREELRRGASHIKIMGSGGVSSPTDPLDRCQYSDEEIAAAVDEAERAGKYVAAHCHPAESIVRSVQLGVRSIEHGTLIDTFAAAVVADKGAYVVPTMAVIFAFLQSGEQSALPKSTLEKLRFVCDSALAGLRIMKDAGVKMGFGTDLPGDMHLRQSSEFELRARVLPAIDILRSACSINAELMGYQGRLGCVQEGAFADLILVDGNPLEDIALLAQPDNIVAVLGQGRVHKWLI